MMLIHHFLSDSGDLAHVASCANQTRFISIAVFLKTILYFYCCQSTERHC